MSVTVLVVHIPVLGRWKGFFLQILYSLLPQEEEAIIKGMSVSAKDRYQDIKDLCEDLYGGYEETSVSENKESEKRLKLAAR